VLGQLKAIAEQEAKAAKEGQAVAVSAVQAKDKEGRNALDIALQFGLSKTATHLSEVLQPTAPAPDSAPAQPDTPVLPTPALDAQPAAEAAPSAEPQAAALPTPEKETLSLNPEDVTFDIPAVTTPAEAVDMPKPEAAEDVVLPLSE
jgi:hypothetical protein